MPNSGPPTLNQVNELLASMEDLSGQISELRRELRRQKIRAQTMTALAIIIVVALVVVGIVAWDNRAALHEIQRTRAERTTISCVYDNIEIKADRSAFVGSILTFADDPDQLDPDQRAALQAYSDAVDFAKPYRDCSPAGIEAHFSSIPEDPATATVVDVP